MNAGSRICSQYYMNNQLIEQWITFGSINARSVKNKTDVIKELLVDKNIDVLAITETWLSAGPREKSVGAELTPVGYEIINISHIKAKGGEVAIVCRLSLKLKQMCYRKKII